MRRDSRKGKVDNDRTVTRDARNKIAKKGEKLKIEIRWWNEYERTNDSVKVGSEKAKIDSATIGIGNFFVLSKSRSLKLIFLILITQQRHIRWINDGKMKTDERRRNIIF